MSIHTMKAKRKARELGGLAGNPAADDLWELSKRELVEVAMRLTMAEDTEIAADAVRAEIAILRMNGII